MKTVSAVNTLPEINRCWQMVNNILLLRASSLDYVVETLLYKQLAFGLFWDSGTDIMILALSFKQVLHKLVGIGKIHIVIMEIFSAKKPVKVSGLSILIYVSRNHH